MGRGGRAAASWQLALRLGVLPHTELQLPAMGRLGALAPELENAQLGDLRVKANGDKLVFDRVVFGKQCFERVRLGKLIVAPAIEQFTGFVGLAHGGAEESKRGGLADNEPEFAAGDVEAGPFLHAERHDTEGLQRPRRPGNRQARSFDADVIRTGGAAPDSDAAVLLGPAVISRPAGHGVIEVVLAFKDFWR